MQNENALLLEAINKLTLKIEVLEKKVQNPSQNRGSSDLKELCTALAKAQGEMPIASLNKQNPYFKSRYADLTSIVAASRPALAKNGLSVTQDIQPNDDGQNILTTTLWHSSGQYLESCMRILPPKNDIQTIQSYTTYLKRMAYASLVGVVTGEEDDDGEVAMVEAREMIARGPSTKYNPKEQSYETITKEQLEELEYELSEYPDLAEQILDKMQIQSLADLPKSQFMRSVERIRDIKKTRNGK